MIAQKFNHLHFNSAKFVTKACRHGTCQLQHPRAIVSKRGADVVGMLQSVEVGANIIHTS